MSSIQSYIYNIQQQLCLLWTFCRGAQITVQQPYKILHRECMNETELSKPVSILKDHGLDNNLSLEIHKKASPYQCGSKRCDLCLIVLNKRTELISKCRHRNNFFWPKLRNNCHGVVFNCLLHILCKNTEQN